MRILKNPQPSQVKLSTGCGTPILLRNSFHGCGIIQLIVWSSSMRRGINIHRGLQKLMARTRRTSILLSLNTYSIKISSMGNYMLPNLVSSHWWSLAAFLHMSSIFSCEFSTHILQFEVKILTPGIKIQVHWWGHQPWWPKIRTSLVCTTSTLVPFGMSFIVLTFFIYRKLLQTSHSGQNVITCGTETLPMMPECSTQSQVLIALWNFLWSSSSAGVLQCLNILIHRLSQATIKMILYPERIQGMMGLETLLVLLDFCQCCSS